MATLTGATIANTYKTLMKGGTNNPVALASDNSDSERVVFGEDDDADVRTDLYLTRNNVGIGIAVPAASGLGSADPLLQLSGAQPVIALTDTDGVEYSLTSQSTKFRITEAGAPRLTINTDGNVGIGTDDPTSGLLCVNDSSLSDTEHASIVITGTGNGVENEARIGVIYEDGAAATGTNAPTGYLRLDPSDGQTNYLWFDDADNLEWTATITNIGGTGGAVIGTQSSDERLKNISSDPFPYGLSQINSLVPIKYTYKADKGNVDKIGFGAQTTKPIIPECVTSTQDCIDGYHIVKDEETGKETSIPNSTGKEPKMTMEYVQMIPVLVKAVQELSAKVTALENA